MQYIVQNHHKQNKKRGPKEKLSKFDKRNIKRLFKKTKIKTINFQVWILLKNLI